MQSFRYDSVGSTNDVARRLIGSGDVVDGQAYVVARHQTNGRGTYGRVWCSPKDAGIYMSVVHCVALPRVRREQVVAFTMSAGVACVEVIRAMTGVQVYLKPVNDLLVNNRKLGGILIETVLQGETIQAVITGIGINVSIAERPIHRLDTRGAGATAANPTKHRLDTRGTGATAAGATETGAIPAQPICLQELVPPVRFALINIDDLIEAVACKVDQWHGYVFDADYTRVERAFQKYQKNGE